MITEFLSVLSDSLVLGWAALNRSPRLHYFVQARQFRSDLLGSFLLPSRPGSSAVITLAVFLIPLLQSHTILLTALIHCMWLSDWKRYQKSGGNTGSDLVLPEIFPENSSDICLAIVLTVYVNIIHTKRLFCYWASSFSGFGQRMSWLVSYGLKTQGRQKELSIGGADCEREAHRKKFFAY